MRVDATIMESASYFSQKITLKIDMVLLVEISFLSISLECSSEPRQ